jgi:hypothetical protein
MVRPYWYPRGRILETGVPEAYLNQNRNRRKITKRDIINFGLKDGRRKQEQKEIIPFLKNHQLTPIQKRLGARRVA